MGRKKVFSKEQVTISGLEVDVLRKNVKNLNLRVYPGEKRIRVSVPRRIPDKAVYQFLEDKLPWIRMHLNRYQKKPKTQPLKYVTGEKHQVWGKEYALQLTEKNAAPRVTINQDGTLYMQIRPGTDRSKRAHILKEWYRGELKEAIPALISKWEEPMKVSVNEFGVKKMKTRWGTCNIRARRIWLNLELAKKRPELLEYVVIHEMVHLLERLHSKRFYGFMSTFLPEWKSLKNELNGKSSISDC